MKVTHAYNNAQRLAGMYETVEIYSLALVCPMIVPLFSRVLYWTFEKIVTWENQKLLLSLEHMIFQSHVDNHQPLFLIDISI